MRSLFGAILLVFTFAYCSNGKVTETVSRVVYLDSDDVSSDVELTPEISATLRKLGFIKHLILDSFIDEDGQLVRTKAFRFQKHVTPRDLLDTVRKIADELPQLAGEEEVEYVRDLMNGEGDGDVDVNDVKALQIEFKESQEGGDNESDDGGADDDSSSRQTGRKKRLLPALLVVALLLYSQEAH